MSGPTIAAFFSFLRIGILDQTTALQADEACSQVEPDKRFQPICLLYGEKAAAVHTWRGERVKKEGHEANMQVVRAFHMPHTLPSH